MTATISLCMIVKDEGSRLAACLESAAGVVQEIVVVDTGSTDDTLSIAARFGARISTFDFRQPDFAAARNQSLARAGGDWVLVLDADEILTATAPALIVALTSQEANIGYVLRRRNVRPPPAAVIDDYVVRLFPNHPGHRYRGRVHETVDAAILATGGQLRTCHATIDHLLPADDGRQREKSLFYLRILDQELAADPDDVERLSFRRAELHKLGLLDEATHAAERIARMAPGDPQNHVNVGLYRLMHRGDRAGAERAFRAALDVRPDDAAARAYLLSLTGAVA